MRVMHDCRKKISCKYLIAPKLILFFLFWLLFLQVFMGPFPVDSSLTPFRIVEANIASPSYAAHTTGRDIGYYFCLHPYQWYII